MKIKKKEGTVCRSATKETTKITWLILAFMTFSTVWEFGSVTNDFVYFNVPQIIFSWIQMFARYFVPYALMVGELDFTVKSEGSVSSWLH